MNRHNFNLLRALLAAGLLCLTAGVVAPRLQGQSTKYPAQIRVRLDWECKARDAGRLRAEALLTALAKAVYEGSGKQWCLQSFVVDDGYTPLNLADRGVIYFRETYAEPTTEGLSLTALEALERWPKVGALSLPGYVDLGLDLFKDTDKSRNAYAEKAAKAASRTCSRD